MTSANSHNLVIYDFALAKAVSMPLLHVALTTATLCLLESTASLLTTVCCCLPRLSLVLSDAEAAALAASSPAHLLQAGDNYMYIPGVIGTTTASPLHSGL